MNFPIDTIPSSYVWSVLRTLEWLSQVSVSHIQLNAIVTFYCERHLRVSHVLSCLFRQLYINQCKFHMSCLIPRSSSTCTACTTTYYRFFNIWNKLLKCTYLHLSLFHSNVSNIQQWLLVSWKASWVVVTWNSLCEQTDWQKRLKTLPSRNFVLQWNSTCQRWRKKNHAVRKYKNIIAQCTLTF